MGRWVVGIVAFCVVAALVLTLASMKSGKNSGMTSHRGVMTHGVAGDEMTSGPLGRMKADRKVLRENQLPANMSTYGSGGGTAMDSAIRHIVAQR